MTNGSIVWIAGCGDRVGSATRRAAHPGKSRPRELGKNCARVPVRRIRRLESLRSPV